MPFQGGEVPPLSSLENLCQDAFDLFKLDECFNADEVNIGDKTIVTMID